MIRKLASQAIALGAVLFATSATAYAAPPVCVQNMLSGIGTRSFAYTGRPLKVVLHRHDSLFVGYGEAANYGCSQDGLGKDNTTTASASLLFKFSDRFSGAQNFTNAWTETGSLSVNQSTGAITVQLFGVNFGPVVPSCSGNVMFCSTGNAEFWSISFGAPQWFQGC